MLHWGVENIVVLSKFSRAAQCSVHVSLIIWFSAAGLASFACAWLWVLNFLQHAAAVSDSIQLHNVLVFSSGSCTNTNAAFAAA
jgi:hypothetical protein